ncbi:MAG: DNA polymerase III subunit delta' [Microbacteriaceae bacterium]|nr:DNA polymerase III subunit delta' [Microbacteriaceae bacterium]
MAFWSEIVGQHEAVATLDRAASSAGAEQLAHAWLITGPPGSGRYNVALRFAAALVSRETSDAAREAVYPQVAAGTHPDVTLVRTNAAEISVKQMREAVINAYYAPVEGARRVILIEDADRMNAHAANAALKAIEEPPPGTVWILCAPSEADMLPTIRSRTRALRLRTPNVEQVAELLANRDRINPEMARRAATLAQGHIGMARTLASDPEALARREQTVTVTLGIQSVATAMRAAHQLHQLSAIDAESLVERQMLQEREELRRRLGLDPDEAVPADLRSQFRALDDDEKRRRSRAKIDATDRVLTDLLTCCRDIAIIQTAAGQPLINQQHAAQLADFASRSTLKNTLDFAAALETARDRISRGVDSEIALEAALLTLVAAN